MCREKKTWKQGFGTRRTLDILLILEAVTHSGVPCAVQDKDYLGPSRWEHCMSIAAFAKSNAATRTAWSVLAVLCVTLLLYTNRESIASYAQTVLNDNGGTSELSPSVW
jgi:hypothetical protein